MTRDEMTNTIETIKALPGGKDVKVMVEEHFQICTDLSTDDLKALVARLERAESAIDDALGQGTWDAAFVKLTEYRDKP